MPEPQTDTTGATVHVVLDKGRAVSAYTVSVDDGTPVGRAEFVDPAGTDGERVFFHTEVAPEFRGRGLARLLIREALADSIRENITVVPVCPLFAKHLREHGDAYTADGGRFRRPRPADLAAVKQANKDRSMSAERPYIDKEHPAVYEALTKAAAASRTAAREAGLGDDTLELVNIRVSQINGCPTCLSIHFPRARKAGVKQSALDVLSVWREVDLFTDEQKAALDLAESLTVIDTTLDRQAVNARAAAHLTTSQISAVEWTATLINAFNRVSLASGHPVRP